MLLNSMANAVFRFSATMQQGNSEAQGYPWRFRWPSCWPHSPYLSLSFKVFCKKQKFWLQILEFLDLEFSSWKLFWYWFKCWCFWKIQISQIFYFLIDYDILRNLTISFNGTYISLKTFRTSSCSEMGCRALRTLVKLCLLTTS